MFNLQRRLVIFLVCLAAIAAVPSPSIAGGLSSTGAIAITSPTGGAQLKSGSPITVQGTAPAGVTKVIVYFGNATTVTRTADVQSDGTWSVQIPAPIVTANTATTLNAVDSANRATPASVNVTITP